jgi:hypothetical protein
VKSQLNGEGVEAQSKQSRRKKAASLKNDASADFESAQTRNYANASPKGNDASVASGPGRNFRKAPIRGYVSSRDARYVPYYVSSPDARYHRLVEVVVNIFEK